MADVKYPKGQWKGGSNPAGLTIAQIRESFDPPVPPEFLCMVWGRAREEGYVVKDEDVVIVVNPADVPKMKFKKR